MSLSTGSFWAFNKDGKAVKAEESTYADGPFFCHCGKKHEMHLSRPSGKEGKRPFEPYFAHNGKRDETWMPGSECGERNGESMEHLYAKALLREHVGKYRFGTEICKRCQYWINVIDSSDEYTVSIETKNPDGRWRYDCCLVKDGEIKVVMEVFKTSKCSLEKIQSTVMSGYPMAEFHVEDVMKLEKYDYHEDDPYLIPNRIIKYSICTQCQIVLSQETKVKEQELQRRQNFAYVSKKNSEVAGNMIIPFGKHQGLTIQECEVDYVLWMSGRSQKYPYNILSQQYRRNGFIIDNYPLIYECVLKYLEYHCHGCGVLLEKYQTDPTVCSMCYKG